jgi:hypothetical protein
LIPGLFNDAVPTAQVTQHQIVQFMILKDRRERMWLDVAMAYFNILSQYLPGGTEKNHQISVKVSSHQAEI